jgi:hypothetical protein
MDIKNVLENWIEGKKMLTRTQLIFPLLFLLLFFPTSVYAKVDSARLSFQKTVGKSSNRIHIVKKGENLFTIIKKNKYGKDIPLSAIRSLNPGLRDLNRIYPGQELILPPSADKDAPPIHAPKTKEEKPFVYIIKENDSISRIILEELKLNPKEAIQAYRQIKTLNKNIEDMVNLQAGSALLISPDLVKVTVLDYEQKDSDSLQTKKPEQKTAVKLHPALYALLETVRPVIKKMRGSINAQGSYFIPLEGTSQITIDSSLIPSVEMDDGTTVFLDYENRFNDKFKQLIRRYWRNYYFLTDKDLKDGIQTLLNVINHSINYTMERRKKPLTLNDKPLIVVFPDWLIAGKNNKYLQGIFLLSAEEPPLPEAVRIFLEKTGFAVTEMSADSTAHDNEKKIASVPQPITGKDLRDFKGITLAEQLLTALGEIPAKQEKIAIFKKETDGFNLSITADLLFQKGERKLIIHSKKLPDQFVKILNDSQFDLISIGENEKGRFLIEALLKKAGYPVSFGYFSCMIPEESLKSRFEISFSALSFVNDGERVYLLDFDMPAGILSVINSRQKTMIIRY